MSWDSITRELGLLSDFLARERDTRPTSESLKTYHGLFERNWRERRILKISDRDRGIPVPPPRNQGLHPVGSEVENAFLCFDFRLGEDAHGWPVRADFQVRITGVLNTDVSIVELEDHWRVDTERYATEGGVPREPHPHFHFQRGGHAQEEFAGDDGFVPGRALPPREDRLWRGLLQAPSPRIPFFPMCPILAIDFTIGQHNGIVWQRLRAFPEYNKLIKNAQKRLWNPFLDCLADPKARRRWFGPILLH